jgi:hypothetical protein
MPITLQDLAFMVSDHFRKKAIDAILTGGACVTLYTKNAYSSFDLDFVLRYNREPRLIKAAMEELGFRLESGRFVHPDSEFFIEILPPPPSVGEEPIRRTARRRRGARRLEMLTPTDCVKDRLAAFYHWHDRPSLAQALLVAEAQKIDLRDIGRWSKAEGMNEPYLEFRRALGEKSKRTSPSRRRRAVKK